MELPSWVITTLTLASIVFGLLWVSTIVRSQAKAFDRARALINGVAEDFRLGRVNPKDVNAEEALDFVKGYVRALDENLLITETQSVAIRKELECWPETRIER